MLNHLLYLARRGLPLVTLLAVSFAGNAGAQRRRDYDRDYRSNVDTTFAFERRGLVAITIGAGDIVVTSWDRDEIRGSMRDRRA